MRTARALETLPQVSAAMERGEVSYSKVRAMTRVATPENEHYFLHIALHGTAHHVETLVRAYRRATEAEELSREQQQRTHREVRYCWDVDGSLILKARLPADVGALVLKALEAAVPETPPDDVDRPTWSHRRADAMAVIFESFLAHGAEAMSGGERHQVVVHGRVAPGDFSPRAPTDPDVQISRIRLFDLRIRCAWINAVNDAWRQEGIAMQELLEPRPGHVRTMIATVEPLAPSTLG